MAPPIAPAFAPAHPADPLRRTQRGARFGPRTLRLHFLRGDGRKVREASVQLGAPVGAAA